MKTSATTGGTGGGAAYFGVSMSAGHGRAAAARCPFSNAEESTLRRRPRSPAMSAPGKLDADAASLPSRAPVAVVCARQLVRGPAGVAPISRSSNGTSTGHLQPPTPVSRCSGGSASPRWMLKIARRRRCTCHRDSRTRGRAFSQIDSMRIRQDGSIVLRGSKLGQESGGFSSRRRDGDAGTSLKNSRNLVQFGSARVRTKRPTALAPQGLDSI